MLEDKYNVSQVNFKGDMNEALEGKRKLKYYKKKMTHKEKYYGLKLSFIFS